MSAVDGDEPEEASSADCEAAGVAPVGVIARPRVERGRRRPQRPGPQYPNLVCPLLTQLHHPRRFGAKTEERTMANPKQNVTENKGADDLEIDPDSADMVSDDGAESPNRQRAQGEQQNQQKQQKQQKTGDMDNKGQTQHQKGAQGAAAKPQSGQGGQKGGGGRQ